MNLKEFALQEFKAMGYKPIEEDEDGPNKWMQESVLELLEVFRKQGHSGSSAPYVVSMFAKLASWVPLSPVTGKKWEWVETEPGGMLQNKRCSALFADNNRKHPHFVDAIVWQGPDPHDAFTGGDMEGYSSSLEIKGFPFIPKTFRIDVTKEVYSVKKHGKNARITKGNDEDYVYAIKDHSQLDAVWEVYKNPKKVTHK